MDLPKQRAGIVGTAELFPEYRGHTGFGSIGDEFDGVDKVLALGEQAAEAIGLDAKTLTVRLHHLTQAAHDDAVRHLCEQLNATETIFPDTELKLVYQLGTSQIP